MDAKLTLSKIIRAEGVSNEIDGYVQAITWQVVNFNVGIPDKAVPRTQYSCIHRTRSRLTCLCTLKSR